MLIMEQSSERKLELVIAEPISMKAGILFLLSGAAYFSARFLFNRTSASAVPSTSSSSLERKEEEEEVQSSSNSPPIGEAKNIVVDLRNREAELEMRFLLHRDQKEREFKVIEMNHKLSLQMTHMEFLAREVSSMEAEAQRIGDMVTVYLQLLKKIEIYWQEKQMIQKEARKLRKTLRDKQRVVREQGSRLKARDEEISSSQKELDRRDGIIQELESEVELTKCVVDQLKQEKIELLNKLDMEERSVSLSNPQVEGELQEEEYDDKLVKELEHQEKDLINQRWANACLRQELMRYQRASNQEKNHSSNDHLGTQHHRRNKSEDGVVQIDWDAHEHKNYETSSEIVVNHQRFSRRRRFIRKLRRWVEGGKSDERDKHRKNVVVGEEDYCHPRTSVSSL